MQKRTGPSYKITPTQEAKLLAMYANGFNTTHAAREVGVAPETARQCLVRNGVQLRGRKAPKKRAQMVVTPAQVEQILQLSSVDQFSVPLISKQLVLPGAVVREVLRGAGVHPTRAGYRRSATGASELRELVADYLGGASTTELAERVGVTAGTLATWLVQAGVKLRAPGFQRGADHHAWKGGRIERDDGHILVLVYPDDPYYSMGQIKGDGKDGSRYVLENRLVMARKLGRCLTEDETVHHKDLNKANNKIRNLQLRQGKHGKGAVFCCADCGSYNVKATELAS